MSEHFENEIGQIIEPGDRVIMVTTGSFGEVTIREGTFLSVNNGKVRCSYEYSPFPDFVVQTGPNRFKKLTWANSVGNMLKLPKIRITTFKPTLRFTTLKKNRIYKIARNET